MLPHHQQPRYRQFGQTIPPAVIIAMADLFPSVLVYLRPAIERAIAAIPDSWLLQLMGLWTSDLANANSFTDSTYL
jgi:hypothetical protein